MNPAHLISVITPSYNGERFIENCIKNVIEQKCPEVEHVIVDGGSTDGTVDIIRHHAENYSHIRWISEPDQGQSDAMNKGIAMARGDILGFGLPSGSFGPFSRNSPYRVSVTQWGGVVPELGDL